MMTDSRFIDATAVADAQAANERVLAAMARPGGG